MIDIILKAVPLASLQEPVPPIGSDYDQSTLGFTADTAFAVAGEIDGDPAQEHYLSQNIKNDRSMLTGFGGVFGYIGAVTNDLLIGIAASQINPNDPAVEWIAAGWLDHTTIDPDTWYYITAELTVPVEITSTFFIIVATDEPGTATNGWAWTGMQSDVYARGQLSIFNGSNWTPWTPSSDTTFYTFTETEAPPGCEDYTNQVDCLAAGCYWWSDNTCHSTPETPPPNCEDYTTQSACQDAGCFWWSDGTCRDTMQPENGGPCEDRSQVDCTAPCYWYQKYLWEPEKCHSTEQNMMMDYLPFIIAGVGGVIIIVALISRRAPAPTPAPAYYPPRYPPLSPPR